MNKRIFLVLFCGLLLLNLAHSTDVKIESIVLENQTEFRYEFSFLDNEEYQSFSFEKPLDAIIKSAYDKDTNKPISFSIAGKFFIFKPGQNTKNKTFVIEFTSSKISRDLVNKKSMIYYQNFNIPINSLEFTLDLEDDFGQIKEIFPRTYRLTKSGAIKWTTTDVKEDTLFLIEFTEPPQDNNTDAPSNNRGFAWFIYIISIIIIGTIFFFITKYFVNKNNKKIVKEEAEKTKKTKEKSKEKPEEKKSEGEDKDENDKEKENNDEDTLEKTIDKYLTDNEKDVVGVIKDNEGISQYDILNFLPNLSKSNLSKIITKLHAKKYLNRIRVGKVNKIYLGETLKKYSTIEEE
jgi:hypothetical protein